MNVAHSLPVAFLILGGTSVIASGVHVLARRNKQEGGWTISAGVSMLAVGLTLAVLRGKLASVLTPHLIAGIFFYSMLYCILQAYRFHSSKHPAFRMSILSVKGGLGLNMFVLAYLIVSHEDRPTCAFITPLAGTAVLAIVILDILRHEWSLRRSRG